MKLLSSIVLSLVFTSTHAQDANKIFTSDIDNFWIAYDSIRQVDDFSAKVEIINRMYINKGTLGLEAFMKTRDYNDTLYIELIDAYPKYWESIRENTLAVKGKSAELNEAVSNFKRLYPELKDAEMYFTIGGLRSGGTVMGNMVLVGVEIATGTPDVDMSEFKDDWLRSVFARQSLDNVVSINIHEYVHTQQKPGNGRVLNQSIREGSCDFITELVLGRPIKSQHLLHDKSRADAIKAQFKKEMFSHDFGNWLYNGGQKGEEADLGYYVGYEISKSYYENSNDKTRAVKDIIELDFADDEAVEAFLIRSGYFKEEIDKKVLMEQYEESLPYIVDVGPFKNGSEYVDPELKELRITFSKAMNTKGMSFNYTDRGSDYFPITKLKGYEDGDKTMVLFMELKPGTEYEFVITNQGFRSNDGYRLKGEAYLVKFKTR